MNTGPTTDAACLTVSIEEAANLIGVSNESVRRAIHDGELPAFRCGRGKVKGKILIRRQAIIEFIQRRETAGVA